VACRSLPDIRTFLKRVSLPLVLIGIVLVCGSIRLSQFSSPSDETFSGSETIAVIQGSTLQDEKWRKENWDRQVSTHLRLTEKALQKGARLIIWPETTITFYLQEKIPEQILDLMGRHDASLLTGAPRYVGKTGSYTFYNSAFHLTGNGIVKIHDKLHLLPFGEFFPLGFIDVLRLQYAAPRQYSPGEEYTIFSTPAGRFGALICFELIYPELFRGFVKKGADFLVNISNDAWFGRNSAHYQHFSMGVFTAVECRRPVVRAANTGISGFIDATGKIVESLAPFEEGVLLYRVNIINTETFYCRYGDLFAKLCFLGLFFVFFPTWRPRLKFFG